MTNKIDMRPMHTTHIKKDASQITINTITYILVTLFCLLCILPFWMIIASSFSTEEAIRRSASPCGPPPFPRTPMNCCSVRPTR